MNVLIIDNKLHYPLNIDKSQCEAKIYANDLLSEINNFKSFLADKRINHKAVLISNCGMFLLTEYLCDRSYLINIGIKLFN
jgi:hypothetical protein